MIMHLFDNVSIESYGSVLIEGTILGNACSNINISARDNIFIDGTIMAGNGLDGRFAVGEDINSNYVANGSGGGSVKLSAKNKIIILENAVIESGNGGNGSKSTRFIEREQHINRSKEVQYIAGKGGNGGSIVLDASEVVVDKNARIYIGNGGNGGDTIVYMPSIKFGKDCIIGIAVGGDGGNSGTISVFGSISSWNFKIEGGNGGNGGNATVTAGNGDDGESVNATGIDGQDNQDGSGGNGEDTIEHYD